MRSFRSIRVLCALALVAGATALKAQTPNPTPVTDPAITALSVLGVVSDLKAETRQVNRHDRSRQSGHSHTQRAHRLHAHPTG